MLSYKSKWIRVLCETCLRNKDPSCFLCSGASFYFWDHKSSACFNHKGELIEVQNGRGEPINYTRPDQVSSMPELSVMMESIHKWVKEKPVRKWKLVSDEHGWHAFIWSNRYKKEGFECSGDCLEHCVSASYQRVLALENKQRTKL